MPMNTDVKKSANTMAADVRETGDGLGERLKHAARERISQAGDLATGLYEQGLDKASELYTQGQRKARQLGTKVEKQVKQRPFQTMLIVAGAATVLGYMLSRRHSR